MAFVHLFLGGRSSQCGSAELMHMNSSLPSIQLNMCPFYSDISSLLHEWTCLMALGSLVENITSPLTPEECSWLLRQGGFLFFGRFRLQELAGWSTSGASTRRDAYTIDGVNAGGLGTSA